MSRDAQIGLRAASEADLPAITTIYAHHVRTGTATFEIEPPDAAEMSRRWRDIVERGLPYLVAIDGANVVGYAYGGPYRPRPAYRYTVEDSIYIRADYAGQGIGGELLRAVIGDAANAASIRVHAAAGFAHAGVLASVGWKFGRWLDVVLMQRALGTGDTQPVV